MNRTLEFLDLAIQALHSKPRKPKSAEQFIRLAIPEVQELLAQSHQQSRPEPGHSHRKRR